MNHTKVHLGLRAAIGLSVMLVGLLASGRLSAQPKEKQKELTLQVAVALYKAGPTLLYKVTNNSKEEVMVDEAGISRSPITVVKPNGEAVESVIFGTRLGPEPKLAPGQSRTESANAFDLFTGLDLNTPGTYRLYWRSQPHGSPEIYRSNEVLIVREKDTPAFDSKTGMPIVPKPDGDAK